MDSIAAKVAKEIGVLLEHDHIDAGPREQKREHHTGWATPGDATASFDSFDSCQVVRRYE